MKAAQRLAQAAKQSTETTKPKRATSEHDWILAELAEGKPLTRSSDPINDAVGRKIYIQGASLQDWRHPRTRLPFFVSRYYPHDPKIIIDLPETEDEQAIKAEFFAQTDLTYVAIAPMESMAPDELRERVRQGLLKTAAGMAARKKSAPVVASPKAAVVVAKPASVPKAAKKSTKARKKAVKA